MPISSAPPRITARWPCPASLTMFVPAPAASKFGGKSNPLRWFIYFDTLATLPEALDVCVQEVELGLPAMSHQANSGRSQRCYVFLRDSVPSSQLIEEWAEKQMLKESDSGFLSALDLFTYSCVRGGFHNVPQVSLDSLP